MITIFGMCEQLDKL